MARELVTISLEERKYTPKDWLDEKGNPEEKAFTIKFKPLSKRALAQFSDSSSRLSLASNTILLGNAENAINVFRANVSGWENLIIDGKPRTFKRDLNGLVEEDIIEILPLDIIEEVATYMIRVSKFPEEEKGK